MERIKHLKAVWRLRYRYWVAYSWGGDFIDKIYYVRDWLGYWPSFLIRPWFTRWLRTYPVSRPLAQFAQFCRAPFWVVNIFDDRVSDIEIKGYLACALLRLKRLRSRCGDDWYRDRVPFLNTQVMLWKTLARWKNNLRFAANVQHEPREN